MTILYYGLNLHHYFECARFVFLSACTSLWNIPVDHADTGLGRRLEKMALYMKKFLQTVLLFNFAGIKASWKAAGGAWGVHPGSCPLPLLDGTGAAFQPWSPSLPRHRDLTAGCLEIHVWMNLVCHGLTGQFLLLANPFQYIYLSCGENLAQKHLHVSTMQCWSCGTTELIRICWLERFCHV